LFLPPANRCFSPTRDSKTSRSAARVARQSGRKAAVEGIRLHAQKQKPVARSAARKLQFPSGQRKVARYFAENASRPGARWEQLRKQFETGSWNDQQKGTRNRGVPFCFFNLFPDDFVISRRTRERSRLQISLELRQRFRHVLSSKTKSNVPGLVVNRPGKQQHTRFAHQILAPVVNILLRFEPRKPDGRGVRRRPVEDVVMTRKECSKQGKVPENNLQISIDELLTVPEGQCCQELTRRASADGRGSCSASGK